MEEQLATRGLNDMQKQYIASFTQTGSLKLQGLVALYIPISSSPIAGFKAFGDGGEYLTVAVQRQPRNRQRTSASI